MKESFEALWGKEFLNECIQEATFLESTFNPNYVPGAIPTDLILAVAVSKILKKDRL